MHIPIITVYSDPAPAQRLIQSATKRGWTVIPIQVEWKGFGTKLISVYNYLKEHPEVEQFVFCDAYDVYVFGTPEEFEYKFPAEIDMLVSSEKGLWPPYLHPFRSNYPNFEHGFNYINSGCYFAESWYFKYLIETYPPTHETDDQFWLNVCSFLEKRIEADYEQKIFNSHSFVNDGEYGYKNGRIQILGNESIFCHTNGKTFDEKLEKVINETN